MSEDYRQLIFRYDHLAQSSLEDLLMIMANAVERSMLQAGAVPGEDYTLLDLYKLGQPFALAVFELPGNDIDYALETGSKSQ